MELAPVILADAVSRELSAERVLWTATPDRWAYASKDWKKALAGIPFVAFAIFWTYQATSIPSKGNQPMSLFFPLWGLMFVGFGLSMLLSPLFAAWKSRRVYYAVTEKRAVIFEKVWALKIQSFDGSGFGGFERESRGGPGGNIIFKREVERRGKGTNVREVGFMGLGNFAQAEQALNRMMAIHGRA